MSDEIEEKTIDDFNDLNIGPNLNHKNFLGGIASSLGLAMPPGGIKPQWFMVTVNLPTKEKFKFNLNTTRQWRDYKPSEQYKIISRQGYLLSSISDKWEMYYEYTKEVNLHTHVLLYTKLNKKEIFIDYIRFFGVKPGNRYAVHVVEVNDLDGVRSYLTGKTVKTYQTAPFSMVSNETWNK